MNFPSCLDKLSSLLMMVGRSAPRYERMALLYPRSKILQSNLAEYFLVVVRLAQQLSRLARKSTFGQLVSSFPNDSDTKSYQAELERWASSIREEVNLLMGQKIEEQGSSLKALLKSSKSESQRQKLEAHAHILDFCSTYDYQKTWKALRKAGNATLFDRTTEYSQWKAETKSSTLVYRGKLGAGKSVLLANIVDDLNLNAQSGDTVAYFFCRHDDFESLKADTVIGSLARQLLRSVPNPTEVWQHIQGRSSGRDSESILEVIERFLPTHFKAYFILDGLDECENCDRDAILEHLQQLRGTISLRLCVSSRIEADRISSLGLGKITENATIVIPDDNPDIEGFIRAELEGCIETGKLTIGDPSLILEIEDALVQGAQGMFLWVALQMETLCAAKTDQEVRQALSDLPRDLPDTFLRILRRTGKQGKHYQMRTFQIIIAARRPLTTEELREALSVVPGDDVWSPARFLHDVYSALACCGSLITVDEEDSTVKLVHHSVKQFLLGKTMNLESAQYLISNAEGQLRDIIITYLSYGVFENQLSSAVIPQVPGEVVAPRVVRSLDAGVVRNLALKFLQSRRQPNYDLGKALTEAAGMSPRWSSAEQFRFYQYAKDNWLWHAGRESDPFNPATYILFVKLVSKEATRTGMRAEERWRLLFYAIEFSWDEVFELLAENGQPKATTLQELAFTFVEEGNVDMLQLLISTSKVDMDVAGGHSKLPQTLLAIAARNGHTAIVKLLLDTGKADLNARDFLGRTPLAVAVIYDRKSVVRLLLDTENIDVNARDSLGKTPLSNAAKQSGPAAVSRMLLATSTIEINTEDNSSRTPLSHAAEKSGVETLRLLLTMTDADLIDKRDYFGRTPLSYAAANYHRTDDNFMLLLATKRVRADTKDNDGRTLFSHAAEGGNETVASYLLRKGLVNNIDQRDKRGRTPLSHAAACFITDDTVRLLLERGKVEVGSQDVKGRTPLSYAAEKGHPNSVQRLLMASDSSDIDRRDIKFQSPLFYAARRGRKDVVQMFLDTDIVDTTAPFIEASKSRYKEVARMLREHVSREY